MLRCRVWWVWWVWWGSLGSMIADGGSGREIIEFNDDGPFEVTGWGDYYNGRPNTYPAYFRFGRALVEFSNDSCETVGSCLWCLTCRAGSAEMAFFEKLPESLTAVKESLSKDQFFNASSYFSVRYKMTFAPGDRMWYTLVIFFHLGQILYDSRTNESTAYHHYNKTTVPYVLPRDPGDYGMKHIKSNVSAIRRSWGRYYYRNYGFDVDANTIAKMWRGIASDGREETRCTILGPMREIAMFSHWAPGAGGVYETFRWPQIVGETTFVARPVPGAYCRFEDRFGYDVTVRIPNLRSDQRPTWVRDENGTGEVLIRAFVHERVRYAEKPYERPAVSRDPPAIETRSLFEPADEKDPWADWAVMIGSSVILSAFVVTTAVTYLMCHAYGLVTGRRSTCRWCQ